LEPSCIDEVRTGTYK
jgi:tubulin alpha